jgi:hypothetical protein
MAQDGVIGDGAVKVDNAGQDGPEKTDTTWGSIAHLFGCEFVSPPVSWYFTTKRMGEQIAYSVQTSLGTRGATGYFLDNDLLAGAPGPEQGRSNFLNLDTRGSAPVDNAGIRVRRTFATLYKKKLEKYTVALVRVQTELNGDRGYYRWARHTMPNGLNALTRVGRVQESAMKLPFYDVCQGLALKCPFPEKAQADALIGSLIGLPLGLTLSAVIESHTDVSTGLMLPAYNTEAQYALYRTVLQLAQAFPNNWVIYLPSAPNQSVDITAVAAVPPTTFVVGLPAGPQADTTDPLSVLPKQAWASEELVAFGKLQANMGGGFRGVAADGLKDNLLFNIAGFRLPGFKDSPS